MSTYIFLGPTLSRSEARFHLDATYLPPVEQGDVLKLLSKEPRVIGIVDGRFQFVPSVWHKEILAALAEGVHVFGAASMGALRAAELESFGMVGVGEVFERYRSGELEDDDEVAVAHAGAEHEYREASDAMVNIRDACSAAVKDGILSTADAEILMEIAKALYFPERSWARIFEIGRDEGLSPETISAMKQFCKRHITLKRRDAIQLLQRIHRERAVAPFTPQFQLERTIFLDQLRSEVTGPPARNRVERKKVLLEVLSLEEARRSGDRIDDTTISEMSEWFREQCGLFEEDSFNSFKLRAGLSPETFRDVMERFAALARVQDRYAGKIDEALPGHLAVMSARSTRNWSQWNVALSRQTTAAAGNAANVFSTLATLIATLREAGVLRLFYFMRKAPDIRLRFQGEVSEIDRRVKDLLEKCKSQGWVEGCAQSVYEAESALFGGERAMELVHAYFDADTSVWMEWATAPFGYSLAVLTHLFENTLQSGTEVWQTWEVMTRVDDPVDLGQQLPAEDWPLHDKHLTANLKLALGLQELWSTGNLQLGLRAILSSVAMFHFNRYGVSGPLQAAAAKFMAAKLRPLSHAGATS